MNKVQMRSDYPEQKKEKKPSKVKKTVSETVNTTARVVRNAEQLVQAVSLLVITVFAYTQVKEVNNDVWYFIVLASLAVVGVRATYEFLRFLAKDK